MKNLGLPKKVLFCKKCVISNQDQVQLLNLDQKKLKKKYHFFDQEGVCDD